jgi:putative hydrolase of HD superfamily
MPPSLQAVFICTRLLQADETKYKALQFAVLHDVPELTTGDISFDVKFSSIELYHLLNEIELQRMKEKFPEFVELYQQFLQEEKDETLAALVVELADRLSTLQFIYQEIQLGNQFPQIKIIKDKQEDIVSDVIDKIEVKINKK